MGGFLKKNSNRVYLEIVQTDLQSILNTLKLQSQRLFVFKDVENSTTICKLCLDIVKVCSVSTEISVCERVRTCTRVSSEDNRGHWFPGAFYLAKS